MSDYITNRLPHIESVVTKLITGYRRMQPENLLHHYVTTLDWPGKATAGVLIARGTR